MWKLIRKIWKTGILTEKRPLALGSSDKVDPPEFTTSLSIRHVDTGSCNGCELELHALSNPYYSSETLGIRFVASPRHADLLLVTGPVTHAMKVALVTTNTAVPCPKRVVAVGDCAINGGIYRGSYAVCDGVSNVLPVNVSIAGCPPDPTTVLEGIRKAFARSDKNL